MTNQYDNDNDNDQTDLFLGPMRQAMRREAIQNIRFAINTALFALVSTPILLALILWRVW